MVQRDSFSFCGVDMLGAYGIRAVTYDVLLPRLRPRLLTVPGRDGSIDFGAERYEDRVVRLECDTRRRLGRDALRELAALLARKGPLELWDDPGRHYVGRLYDDVALEYLGCVGHAFELSFLCEPFAYGRRVDGPLAGPIGYRGTAAAPARIAVTNGGGTSVVGLRMLVRRLKKT